MRIRRISDHVKAEAEVRPVEGGWVSWPSTTWVPGSFYSATYWELIPEERWETITDACTITGVNGQQVLSFHGEEIGRMQIGYRLASLRIERLVRDPTGGGETHD